MFLRGLAARSVVLLLLFLLLLPAFAAAGEINLDQAKWAAQNWLYAVADHLQKDGKYPSIIGEEVIEYNDRVVGYNFILQPVGHIIVPARDELPPVKLYSLTSTLSLGEDSDAMQWISEELYKLSEALDDHAAELAQVDLKNTHNSRLWAFFDNDPVSFPQAYERASAEVETLSLGPLLSTTWDQEDPYNMNTPLWHNGQKTPTGCVATAAAQIMKFWNYPATGQSSTSYTWNNGSTNQALSRDFSASTYNWASMTNTYGSGSTAAQKAAVAKLMSDVGIAFNMDYGPSSVGGSAASTMYGTTVFPTYFKYKSTINDVYRGDYASDSAWMQVFKNEVQSGRPSQLRIKDPGAGGHSIVVDGYRDSPSEQIHLNMGWSGSYDGWYVSNNIVTGGYNWSDVNYQAAVIGIEPASSATYSMSGTVRSGSTTGPVLVGATVSIAGKTATTSSTGTFSITGIPAGTYTLTIAKTGYITKITTGYIMNSNKTGLVFFLSPTGTTYSMSGKVRSGSTTGTVLAGATVSIAGKTATTSGTGTFSITGIPAGTYTVTISKTGYITKTVAGYVINSNKTGVIFFLKKASVTAVKVINGSTSYSITGLYITLSSDPSWGSNRISTPIPASGNRTITGFAAGKYDLQAVFSNGSEYEKWGFTVSAGATTTITATASSTTTGSVKVINGSTSYSITGLYLSPSSSSTWGPNQISSSISAGSSVTLTSVPPDTYDLKTVFSNGSKYGKWGFTVSAGATTTITATTALAAGYQESGGELKQVDKGTTQGNDGAMNFIQQRGGELKVR